MELKRIPWSYILFFGSIILASLANLFLTPSPWIIALTFLALVFVPGFALSRLLKIAFPQDHFGQLILWLTLGLIFDLSICLLAIFLGLAINTLVFFTSMAILIIFIISFCFDWSRPKAGEESATLTFRSIFQSQNFSFLFLGILIVLVLAVVDQLGTNFIGDPMYHLAVMRRAIEGQSITIDNLNHVKNQFHIAYGIPVWHVFLAVIAKITHTNIFILYREITTVLTLLVFLVWYWLFRKILPTKSLAVLALFLLIIYYFQKNAYLYTRMPVPDVLNNLLLLPLSFGLALDYIFKKESTYKNLIILSLMLVFMGLIHWTQYFYYLSAMGLLAILFAIFKYRESDFRPVFKKILFSIFSNMILILPMILFLQLKNNVSSNLQAFSGVKKGSNNDRFYKFTPYMQLALIFLPLLGLFIRKYRRLIFLLAIFLFGPLVYNIPWIYKILRQYLSHVFVNRLYSNIGEWPYVLWALILGFILILIDRSLTKVTTTAKYLRYLIDGFLGILLMVMVVLQFRFETIESWYETVFSSATHDWLNRDYLWLMPTITLLVLIIYLWQKYLVKLKDFFQFDEYQNQISMLSLTLIVVFFFSIPAQGNLRFYFKKEFNNYHFISKAADPTLEIINPQKFGGMATIDFIKNNIPPKSVFDTNTKANYTLPTLVDVHMASYTFDPDPTLKYRDLYEVDISLEKKLAMVKEGDIDYLIYQYQTGKQSPFAAHPEYFTRIFSTETASLYQVNKEKVTEDLKAKI